MHAYKNFSTMYDMPTTTLILSTFVIPKLSN